MSERFEYHHDLKAPPSAVRWDLGERPSPPREREKVCAVRLGDQVFGVPEGHVRGLREITAVTPVPLAPDAVLGVVALGGAIVPLLDLSAEIDAEIGGRTPSTALLVEAGGFTVLLAVDDVVAFERAGDAPAANENASPGGARTTSDPAWAAGSAAIHGRPVPLLDLPALLERLRPTS